MSLDDLVRSAWDEHADRPREVADRLASSTHLVAGAGQVAPYAALVAHVFGEHLGDWDGGAALLAVLGALPACAADPVAQRAVARQTAALRHGAADSRAFDLLAHDDRIAAQATAASMLAGRADWERAIAAFDAARLGAAAGLPADSPAVRALAVTGNNLAAALEEKTDRSAAQTRAMLDAARTALEYWRIAGTWLEEERAEYRLARSCLQAGRTRDALHGARCCIALCEANDAPAVERFFGHAVLAVALRAAGDAQASDAAREQALRIYAALPADERSWCEPDRSELDRPSSLGPGA
jgi:hypothetical protein